MRVSIICLILLLITACSETEEQNNRRNTADLTAILSTENNEGFKKALVPREFVFPQDHGSHPRFKTEWWYVTGNLSTSEQRQFGYQLTFFRWGVSPDKPTSASQWATNQIYMVHFALSDIKNNKFYTFERFSRDSLKLAGVRSNPFKIWLLDWTLKSNATTFFPLILNAKQDNIDIQLSLDSIKPMVLQGEQGLSKKSNTPGNASYYYSYTRLNSQGTVKIDNESYSVNGHSWLDREWSTSALEKSQSGWDWFALQLSNGDEIMFYQLRHKSGDIDKASSGSFVKQNGKVIKLNKSQVIIEPTYYWKSKKSNVTYPSGWLMKIPTHDINLEITPLMRNQEIDLSVQYWEGAVKIAGNIDSTGITGKGYVELSGYK